MLGFRLSLVRAPGGERGRTRGATAVEREYATARLTAERLDGRRAAAAHRCRRATGG
jgi:hypothetical protein